MLFDYSSTINKLQRVPRSILKRASKSRDKFNALASTPALCWWLVPRQERTNEIGRRYTPHEEAETTRCISITDGENASIWNVRATEKVRERERTKALKRGLAACPLKEIAAPFSYYNYRRQLLLVTMIIYIHKKIHSQKLFDEQSLTISDTGCLID